MSAARWLTRFSHALGMLVRPILPLLGDVLALCSILVIVVLPGAQRPRSPERLRYTVAAIQVEGISDALESYRKDCGEFPSDAEGLDALIRDPGHSGWRGPYLKAAPLDPWGAPFLYRRGDGASLPKVLSLGADRKPGGHRFDADLSSLRPAPPVPLRPRESLDRWLPLCVWLGAWVVVAAKLVSLVRRRPRADARPGS
jgi:general secretion pathway protein G